MKALGEWLKRPWFGPLLALLCVYALFSALTPDTFLRTLNLVTMLRQTVVVSIAAIGMALIIIHGGIDLSVGSTVALATVIVAKCLQGGASPASAVLAALAIGALAGAVNGALVVGLRITPFIATLGTMSALRGIAKGLADEQKIDAPARGLDMLMAKTPEPAWLLLSPGVWLLLLLSAAAAFLLSRTVFGVHTTAVGSSEATARLCGIRVPRVKVAVYMLSGWCAGLAGCLQFARLTVGDPTTALGKELDVIAAVVIGGGSLAGGSGSILGSLLGALLMTVLANGCTLLGLPNYVQEMLVGAIIVGAVALDHFRRDTLT